MVCIRDKGPIYHWIKYNIYKPIRTLSENIRYGYFMSEEAQVESRKQFIRRLKDEHKKNLK